MKIKEISVGLSGVISVASFENFRPSFTAAVEIQDGDNIEECFAVLRDDLRKQFNMEANRAKTDLIEKQYSHIRFREHNGKKYPSVTSILSWNTDWRISDDELMQYAARGTVVHRLVEEYIKTGKWVEPETLPELKDDLIILATGSLKLRYEVCSHKEFFAQYGKDFEWVKTEVEVFNDEIMYSGRYDGLAKYKGKLTLIDFKTGSNYCHAQTAAYAVASGEKIEKLLICPVGPTKNKCGYQKPNVTEDIKGNYKKFLKAREKFRQRFGV